MSATVTITGFEKLAKITRNMRVGLTKNKVNVVQRKHAKPVLAAIRSRTPIAGKTVVRTLKDGTVADIYDPGNLQESMQVFTGRRGVSKDEPTIYIGANVKHNKGADGWYWYFVVKGTKFQAPNDFIGEVANPLKNPTEAAIVRDLTKMIEKLIAK